jgi:hypothetical protein
MVTAITDGDDRDQTDKAPVDANPASVRVGCEGRSSSP